MSWFLRIHIFFIIIYKWTHTTDNLLTQEFVYNLLINKHKRQPIKYIRSLLNKPLSEVNLLQHYPKSQHCSKCLKQTFSLNFQIYEAERSDELVAYQLDKTEVQPHEGWSEQDPLEIMHHIRLCAENAIDQLEELGKAYHQIYISHFEKNKNVKVSLYLTQDGFQLLLIITLKL